MIGIFKNPANKYTILFAIYLLQGILYVSGGYLSQILCGIIICLSIPSLLCCLNCYYKTNIFIKSYNILLISFVIYGIIRITNGTYMVHGNVFPPYRYIKDILLSMLPVAVYFDYSKRHLISEKWFLAWMPVLFGIAILRFYNYELNRMVLMGSDEVTNNISYTFLSMIPMLYFVRNNKIIQYTGLAIIVFFLITGMKRGALLLACIIIPYFLYYILHGSSKKTKIYIALLSGILIIMAYDFILYIISESSYFNMRLEQTLDGDSSSRSEIYGMMISKFFEQDFIYQILGNGGDASLLIFGMYAHNDWIEIAINQGLLGVLCFFLYWLSFYRICIKANFLLKPVMIMLFIIYLGKTFFSMSIVDMQIFDASVFGYCLANYNNLLYNEN